jgi:phosphomannomutase/phosphoglucomutase
VSRNPGADVIFDVKCSRNLNTVISSYGGRPIMWKSGHSFMKEKMAETGALLGGEFSGHIFFNERWFGFDDGMYAAARLIEILSTTDPNLDAQLALLPSSIGTPEIKIEVGERAKFELVEQLAAGARFEDGKLTTLDGIRVDFPDGWGLVRASNTTPALTLRFEADSEESLTRIKNLFKDRLREIDPGLDFGF